MSFSGRTRGLWLGSLWLIACGGSRSSSLDESLGAGQRDAAVSDEPDSIVTDEPDAGEAESDAAEVAEDGEDELDAGEPDAGELDAGDTDAGDSDAGDSDAGNPDTGAPGVLPDCTSEYITVPIYYALTADDYVDGIYVNGLSIWGDQVDSGWQSIKSGSTEVTVQAGAPIVLGIVARNAQNQPGFDRGLLASVTVNNTTLVSDGDWRIGPADDVPFGWESIDFDDSAWQLARVLGANGVTPWGTRTEIDPGASWIWAYDPSSTPARPTSEVRYFRLVFSADANGAVSRTPSCVPIP